MKNWEERMAEMLKVNAVLRKADVGQLWEYYPPEAAAAMSDILRVQERLQVRLSQDYIDFLLCADGWQCFYQLVDLFGTKDFESERMSLARQLLNAEADCDRSLKDMQEHLLPVAVSRTDKDLFVMVTAEGEQYGQVIWLAGGEIDTFSSFSDFFEAMIDYNKEELEDILENAFRENL